MRCQAGEGPAPKLPKGYAAEKGGGQVAVARKSEGREIPRFAPASKRELRAALEAWNRDMTAVAVWGDPGSCEAPPTSGRVRRRDPVTGEVDDEVEVNATDAEGGAPQQGREQGAVMVGDSRRGGGGMLVTTETWRPGSAVATYGPVSTWDVTEALQCPPHPRAPIAQQLCLARVR